jgi:hypothetical protein
MEEDILKILLTQWPFFLGKRAKEITSHIMKFIEWVGENCFKYEGNKDGWIIITDSSHDIEIGTSEQLYKYWEKHIDKE